MLRFDSTLPVQQASDLAAVVLRSERLVDPALLLAIAYQESRWGQNANHVDSHDHGVFGVRVTGTLRPEYAGNEHVLEDLRTNTVEAVAALVFWRNFHETRCAGVDHAWWAHYRWGRIVGEGPDRVGAVYARLRRYYAATGEPL